MRREDAVVHVELLARRTAFDGRPLVLAREGAGTGSEVATPDDRLPDPGAEDDTWTVTLSLN